MIYKWSIQSANSKSAESPASIGGKYALTLDTLSKIDPVLTGWTILENTGATLDDMLAWAEDGAEEPAPVRSVPLEEARWRMNAIVEANVQMDDEGEAVPDEGYSLIASNKYGDEARNISLSVRAGSEFAQNCWSVNFGAPGAKAPDPTIITFPVMDGLFRTMTSIWPTPWARLRGSAVEYEERTGVIGRTSVETFRHDITWMGYLSADLAPGFIPPADLISERISDGGVLMFAAQERPDPANADQMRRSDLLGAIMDKYYPDPFPQTPGFSA